MNRQKIIAAEHGYFLLKFFTDDKSGEFIIDRLPIIAWGLEVCIDEEGEFATGELFNAAVTAITVVGKAEYGSYIVCPTGSVFDDSGLLYTDEKDFIYAVKSQLINNKT